MEFLQEYMVFVSPQCIPFFILFFILYQIVDLAALKVSAV